MALAALALVRASCSSSARLSYFLPRCLLSTTSLSITRSPPIPSTFLARRSLNPLSQVLRALTPVPTANRFTAVRCRVNRSSNSAHAPPNSESNSSFRPFPISLSPDFKHWTVVMKNRPKPEGDGSTEKRVTKQQMIDYYIKTLAKVVGSEEESKKKIYYVARGGHYGFYGFGCEIDRETADKVEELPEVWLTIPQTYLDPEYKDYGGELLVNGEIVPRSPERQRRVDQQMKFIRSLPGHRIGLPRTRKDGEKQD